MGLYVWECVECGHSEEHVMPYDQAICMIMICDKCGRQMRKIEISRCEFHLKGDGFYSTDSKMNSD